MAVHVAPLTDVERAAIASVAAAFPNYRLVGVQASQSYAEADAQITAINAVLHRDSTVGMDIDGHVTVTVFGVADKDKAQLEAAIIRASQQVPAGVHALPPIVNISSEPSALSQ
ncbi:MAG TPA: hypothetical protein VFV00_00980 [Acidimicrobiales bacterium]|nr:hypothetical protein [Acidimicrobiales bacterium]